MTTPLIIDKEILAKLKNYAEKNPLSITEMMAIEEEKRPFVGDRQKHTCHLKFGFRVVLSIEECHKHGVWVRRMSMSLNRPGRVPSVDAVELVCQHLGFPSFKECQVNFMKEWRPPYVEVVSEEKQ